MVDVKLGVGVLQVALDGACRQVQLVGDLRIGQAVGGKGDDLGFASRHPADDRRLAQGGGGGAIAGRHTKGDPLACSLCLSAVAGGEMYRGCCGGCPRRQEDSSTVEETLEHAIQGWCVMGGQRCRMVAEQFRLVTLAGARQDGQLCGSRSRLRHPGQVMPSPSRHRGLSEMRRLRRSLPDQLRTG